MEQRKQYAFFGLMVMGLFLAGCSIAPKSHLGTSTMEVRQDVETAVYKLDRLEKNHIAFLADDHRRRGVGAMTVMVTYDAEAKGSPADAAVKKATKLRNDLEKAGVGAVRMSVIPSDEDGEGGDVIVSYRALDVLPPRDCVQEFPGVSGTIDAAGSYRLGCESEKLLSKMVARPRDLLGDDGVPDGLSRRQGSVAETYMAGEEQPELPDIVSTDIGN